MLNESVQFRHEETRKNLSIECELLLLGRKQQTFRKVETFYFLNDNLNHFPQVFSDNSKNLRGNFIWKPGTKTKIIDKMIDFDRKKLN